MDENKNSSKYESKYHKIFESVGRCTFMKVNLDAVTNNVKILRSHTSKSAGMIAIIKAFAYGHGSVQVGRHLKSIGVERLGVATVDEGRVLRLAGITGPIHVLGNANYVEICDMLKYNLIPTVTTFDFLRAWGNSQNISLDSTQNHPVVNIKLDTGLSRNGLKCDELDALMQLAEDLGVTVDGMFTHFAQSWDDPTFSQEQLNKFMTHAGKYRTRGIKLHVANSAGVIRGYGTDLDFIRPGLAIYGLPLDSHDVNEYESLGFKPAISWLAKPTMVKEIVKGSYVGYDKTYRAANNEILATFCVGYADGYSRHLSDKGIIKDSHGQYHPVVGRVSMDAITVRVNSLDLQNEIFTLLSDDYDNQTSAYAWANKTDTITWDIGTSLNQRVSRIYVHEDSITSIQAVTALEGTMKETVLNL